MANLDSPNPFDQVDPNEKEIGYTPAPAAPKNPFDDVDLGLGPSTSTTGAFAHAAERGVLPGAAAWVGAGYGAEAGAAFGPAGAGLGALAGGIIGGFGASYAASKAQDYALSAAPDSWKEAIGQDDRQQRLEQEQHPYASFLGGLAPYALTLHPGALTGAALPENATALQRILANPVTARVFGGAAMGGMEIAQEKAAGSPVDWADVAIATGFGVVFNKPTRLGERLESAGAGLFRRASVEGPTVAEGGDAKVIGPGIDENVFTGSHVQDQTSEKNAQETVRIENAVLGKGPAPDVDLAARRAEPDLFGQYDALNAQMDAFRSEISRVINPADEDIAAAQARVEEAQQALTQHLEDRGGYAGGPEARRLRAQLRNEQRLSDDLQTRRTAFEEGEGVETPQTAALRQQMMTVDNQLRDMGREVAAARRRAAESVGAETAEPLPSPTAFPTATPAVAEVVARPDVAAAIANPQINHNNDVPFGAGASNTGHVTNIDRRIPQHDPRVLDRSGQPADLWKYLNIHEQVEKAKMDEGVPYKEAHENFATAAERAAVEADGVDWKKYTEVMDGFLKGVEHEHPANPPPDLYLKPYPHAMAETIKANEPRSIEQQRAFIQGDVREKLIKAGRPAEEAEAAAALTSALYETHAARMFTPENPRTAEEIYRAEAPEVEAAQLKKAARGRLRIADGRALLQLAKDANVSTYVHELAHDWLERIIHDAGTEGVDATLKRDAEVIRKWLGAKGADISRAKHEKFARSFEQYLREGVAPSVHLAGVFAKFKNWLLQIYQTIKGLGQPINEDIRGVFDRMLSEEPQRVTITPERPGGPTLPDVHEGDAKFVEPQDAEASAVRVDAERLRYAEDQPPEVAHEIEAAVTEIESEAAKAQPAGEPEPGAGGLREVVGGGGEAGAEPGRGGVGAGGGAERASVNGPVAEGGGVRGAESERRERAGAGPQPLAPAPTEILRPADDRFVDRAGNIRVENLTNVAEVAQAIHASADRNDEFRSVTGKQTPGQMSDLADAMGLTFEGVKEGALERLLGGTHNLGARILAARRLVVDSATKHVAPAMARAADTNDPKVLAELAQAIQRHDMIQSALAGVTAEWGRAGTAFRSLMEGWKTGEDVNELLKANTGRDLYQLKLIAKMGKNLDSAAKVAKYLRDAQKRSFGRMVLEYWINGLISGLATHVTYVVGNQALEALHAGPETLAAALIGQARETLGRTGPRVYAGEVGANVTEYIRSLPKAAQAAIEALRTGQTTLLPGEKARPLTPFVGDTMLHIAKTVMDADVNWSEAGADLHGFVRGMRDGMISWGKMNDYDPMAPLIGAKYSPQGQIPNIALKGVTVLPLGSVARAPSRMVATIHSFFRASNYSISKNAQAFREATAKGLTGQAFMREVARIRQDPSTEAMNEASRLEANQRTLMDGGHELVKMMSRVTNWAPKLPLLGETPVIKFIDPFVHIAANIIDQSIVKRTPVGLLSNEIRADLMGHNGNIAQDTAMARMLVGTGMAVGFGTLAAEGYMTGSGPSDPAKAAVWRMAGNQAHSVRIGDVWYDVHRLGPLGMLAGVAADMYDVAHLAAKDGMLTAGAALMHGFSQNILDESFMRGPAELIQAVEDPGRYGERYIQNFLSSFVPYSVLLSQIDRSIDPYSRQARTVMDSVKAKIEGLSETLFPRRDIWGEPMPNRDALISSGVTAIYESRMSRDPVNTEMAKLGMGVALVPKAIRGVKLTEQEYDDFARIAGRMTKMRLDAIVNSPDWRTFPPHAKRDVITENIKASREAARGVVMGKYPHIPADAARNKNAKSMNDEED
jgi:hypothetical protein